MQYKTLGRTGLKVSRLCLGTMNFGPHATRDESFAQMDKALELGINFFDTADGYGGQKGEGVTEQIIGEWFNQGGHRRECVILATKVFGDMDRDPRDITLKRGLNAVKIRRSCEASLKRLRTDYIDLYQMHHVARETPWEEIWQAFDVLIKQGKVVYVGSSNFAAWHIAHANAAAHSRHMVGLVCEQSKYSLLTRAIELEVMPACQALGLGVIAYSPLEGGLLAGVSENTRAGRRANPNTQRRLEKLRPQLQAWEHHCQQLNEKPADLALAWMLHNPALTAPIIGPRTMEQLVASTRALDIKLDQNQLAAIDRIFPGPKGPTENGTADWTRHQAPEAYAW